MAMLLLLSFLVMVSIIPTQALGVPLVPKISNVATFAPPTTTTDFQDCCLPLVESYYIVDYAGNYTYLLNEFGWPVYVNGRPVFEKIMNTEWHLWYIGHWKVDLKQNTNNQGYMYINNNALCPNDLGQWEGWVINQQQIEYVGTVTCA